MTRGVKVRLIAFVALAAIGVVYVAGTYLGLIDRLLGRGLHLHATLPDSGGLFVGSEVTYRGVKIGKVTAMEIDPAGLRADLSLQDGVRIPRDAAIHVHNLSAVGEQYLDIEPASGAGPFAREGDTLVGNAASLPVDEADLLVDLDAFVNSVDRDDLKTVINEAGTMFGGTAGALEGLIDNGDVVLRAAVQNEDATFRLLDNGRVVLRTQQRNARALRGFSRDLADLSSTLKRRDPQLRDILEGGAASAREVTKLMKGLAPTLPIFLSDLVTLNQVVTVRLSALEQLLVTFPLVVSSGFTGTPGDGYGHINLQLDQSPACTEGYMPPSQWRDTDDLEDSAIYPARCLSGPPLNLRGSKYAPSFPDVPGRASPHGTLTRGADAEVPDVSIARPPGQLTSIFGSQSWQWMLVGPVTDVFPEQR